MSQIAQIFESIMLVCFGLSWPVSVVKAIRSKTARGKSMFFQFAVFIGYLSGIMGKLAAGNITYVFWLYVLNTSMIVVDTVLFFRNRHLDKLADEQALAQNVGK